jgi:hypothetical protein
VARSVFNSGVQHRSLVRQGSGRRVPLTEDPQRFKGRFTIRATLLDRVACSRDGAPSYRTFREEGVQPHALTPLIC